MDMNSLIETLATYDDQQRVEIIDKANKIARERQSERRRQRCADWTAHLVDLIETIQSEEFSLSIMNLHNHKYVLDLEPHQEFTVNIYES